MSEQTPRMEETPRRTTWLYALIAALVVAVAVQGAYLFSIRHEISKVQAATTHSNDNQWQSLDTAPSQNNAPPANQNQNQKGNQSPFQDPFSSLFANPFGNGKNPNTWDPFKQMAQMQRQMDSMFNNAFQHFQHSPKFNGLTQNLVFSPKVDMTENATGYTITVDMPGVNQSNLNVKVDHQTLTITGTRQLKNHQKKGGKILDNERVSGTFMRSIHLPTKVDPATLKTQYKNGVFTITIQKAKDSSPSTLPKNGI